METQPRQSTWASRWPRAYINLNKHDTRDRLEEAEWSKWTGQRPATPPWGASNDMLPEAKASLSKVIGFFFWFKLPNCHNHLIKHEKQGKTDSSLPSAIPLLSRAGTPAYTSSGRGDGSCEEGLQLRNVMFATEIQSTVHTWISPISVFFSSFWLNKTNQTTFRCFPAHILVFSPYQNTLLSI